MFFSIVIPLYNKAYSIEDCVKSVLNQSYSNFELIVVNDGSTDESILILNKVFFDEIRTGLIRVFDQRNKGVSAARNLGIDASRFDYICFLDADDIWKPDFLKNMALLVGLYPSAGMYCLQHEVSIVGCSNVLNPSSYNQGYIGLVDNFFKRSIKGSIANSSKVCIRKVVFSNLGFFPLGQKAGEDLYLWIKIALNYPVAFFNSTSVVINSRSDTSRKGRNVSVPYPLVYYSGKDNRKDLGFWAKIYFFKIYCAHLYSSLKKLDYIGFEKRRVVGVNLFPISSFLFLLVGFPLRILKRDK